MKLKGKIIIAGEITAETGLHIGGSKSALDIGGVDLNIIKTPDGIPYIPGSSLKGKLRTMLARMHGSQSVQEDPESIQEIFGNSDDSENKGKVTRLLVRDADLDVSAFNGSFGSHEMDFEYSDVKWENTINRKTGTAQHPRQLERVPSGARFRFELVYDVYDDEKQDAHLTSIRTAMRLLEADYIGGQGSRGYGKISFDRDKLICTYKSIQDFENGTPGNGLPFNL